MTAIADAIVAPHLVGAAKGQSGESASCEHEGGDGRLIPMALQAGGFEQSLSEASRTATITLSDCTIGTTEVNELNGKEFELETHQTWQGQYGTVYKSTPPQDLKPKLGLNVAMKIGQEGKDDRMQNEASFLGRIAEAKVPHALKFFAGCTISTASDALSELKNRFAVLTQWLPPASYCYYAARIRVGRPPSYVKNDFSGHPILKATTSGISESESEIDPYFDSRPKGFIDESVDFFCGMTVRAGLVDNDRNMDMGDKTRHYNQHAEHNMLCTLDKTEPFSVHPLHFDFDHSHKLDEHDGLVRLQKMWSLTVLDAAAEADNKLQEVLSENMAKRLWKKHEAFIRQTTGGGDDPNYYRKYAEQKTCACFEKHSSTHSGRVGKVKEELGKLFQC